MAEFTLSCPIYAVLLHTLVTWLLAIEDGQDRNQRLDLLESTREHMRNICITAGIKWITTPLAQMWQVLTAVKLQLYGHSPEEALVSFAGMGLPSSPKSITALCHVAYIKETNFDSSLAAINEFWPLDAKTPAGEWVCNVKSVLHDLRDVDLWKIEDIPEEQRSQNDVIMLVKQFMSRTSISQKPSVILPHAMLEGLPLSGPTTVLARNRLSEKLMGEFLKTADLVEKEPWSLTEASEYLRTWVKENQDGVEKEPPTFALEKASLFDQPTERLANLEQYQEFAPDPPKPVRVEEGPPAGAKAKPAAKPKSKATAKSKSSAKAKASAGSTPKAKAKSKAKAKVAKAAKAKAKPKVASKAKAAAKRQEPTNLKETMLCNNLEEINRALGGNAKAKAAPTPPACSSVPDLPSDDDGKEDRLPALEMPVLEGGWDWGSGSEEDESETASSPEPKRRRADEFSIAKSLSYNFGLLSRAVLTGRAQMTHQLVSEVFSPPRVTLAAKRAGYEADFAFDVVYNYWDAMNPEMKAQLKDMLQIMKPNLLACLVYLNWSAPSMMKQAARNAQAAAAAFVLGLSGRNVGMMLGPEFTYKRNELWMLEHSISKQLCQMGISLDRAFTLQFHSKASPIG
eukprot:s449_g29.t1